MARQTINLIENNKYNPSLALCIELAKALKTDLNSLFWEGD
ncbi:Transcription regulator, probable-related protein [Bacillus thuringiensis serovar thuringiensis str. T01001]|uniref:Transcription regulator, probable-related protein n=1 Tax=Bacillus mycoides TaxID=1405 RepID=C2Y1X9_BACMY|nr:helix-turn-helix domain-containing protein [Bacillus thuringiensis]EEL03469.1 Transcription regulator, probable-related protein [Bacillus cereus BDRD-ST196]EEL53424.1 Transcription regulator, probable-related protein [Bacillus cereus Rock4-2]EEL68093.1 Transcription regulator, probable-related protein [Bacillus mycoides]EEM32333.1 Transcription regulator, probable-related protein [Bacillus thuringiensis serovar thuringiensis str. T01001]EEM45135.1 Transcription regulator, probable-related p